MDMEKIPGHYSTNYEQSTRKMVDAAEIKRSSKKGG